MEVRFIIDEDTYLSIPFHKPLAAVTKAEEAPVNLIEKGEIKYLLCGNFDTFFEDENIVSLGSILIDTWCALLDLKIALKDVLAGNLQAPKESQDLGYAWNEYIHESQSTDSSPVEVVEAILNRNSYTKSIGIAKEIGSYVLWNPPGLPSTLLYNQSETIIFQVVPLYNAAIHKIPYEVFMRNYAPYFTRIIPRANAEEWLRQTIEILDIMEKNTPEED